MANEKRLIDANAAIKAMNAVDIHFWEDAEDGVEKCVNILHNAPTVDAVEVVRCKNCKKAKEATLCDFICTRDEVMIPMDADDFCSYGERRTDNG